MCNFRLYLLGLCVLLAVSACREFGPFKEKNGPDLKITRFNVSEAEDYSLAIVLDYAGAHERSPLHLSLIIDTVKIGNRRLHSNLLAGWMPSTGTYYDTLYQFEGGKTLFLRPVLEQNSRVVTGPEDSIRFRPALIPDIGTGISEYQISFNSAPIYPLFKAYSGAPLLRYGVVWSTSSGVSLENHAGRIDVIVGSNDGHAFLSQGLQPRTAYYARAYAENRVGIGWGPEITFTTRDPASAWLVPTVHQISANSAQVAATLAYSYFEPDSVTVLWGLSPDVSLESYAGRARASKVSGEYSLYVTNLQRTTSYFARFVGFTPGFTLYSSIVPVNTIAETPAVRTLRIVEASPIGITVEGEVTDSGGAPVIERGVAWLAGYSHPNQENASHVASASPTSLFTVTLSKVTRDTTIQVAAYARNSSGTTYAVPLSVNTRFPRSKN